MQDFIETLDDFTWENYKDISDALVRFDQENIVEELMRQASIYSYYYGLMSLAKRYANELEADLARLHSSLRSEYRTNNIGGKYKLTARDLDDAVTSDPSYQTALQEFNAATFKYELLKGLVRALEQKSQMIVQCSANRREETKLFN